MIIFIVNGLARGIMISCMSVVSLDMLGLAGFATGLGLVLCVGEIVVVASGPVSCRIKLYWPVKGNLKNKTAYECNG